MPGARNRILFALLPMAIFAAQPRQAVSASFDCQKAASYAERTICADKELSNLDDALAKAYGQAVTVEPKLVGEQRHWLSKRATCTNRDCIVSAYRERLAELAQRASAGDTICEQLAVKSSIEATWSLYEESDEEELGQLCGYPGVPCRDFRRSLDISRLREMGVNLDETPLKYLLKDNNFAVHATLVDVNNDGVLDLRLSQLVGSASCQRNYFFIGSRDKTFRFVQGADIDQSLGGGEGAFCAGDGVFFARRGRITYSVVWEGRGGHVYRGTSNGKLAVQCTFSKLPWSDEQQRIAELIRKKYPQALKNATLLRPTLDALRFDNFEPFASKGEKVWSVIIQCNNFDRAHAIFLVHPKTRAIEPVIAPGSSSSWKCD